MTQRKAGHSAAILTIDLDAIVANWRLLRDSAAPADCGAAVKANAYGTGASRVILALARAGCRSFFVATIDEGIAAREILAATPGPASRASVYVLHGPDPALVDVMRECRLVPVLNSLEQIETWSQAARRCEQPWPAGLHVDTGMSRLGLPENELHMLISQPDRLQGVALSLIMSHMACADDPDHPLNAKQLSRFHEALRQLPSAPLSLANSSAIFLGKDYHFDSVRPGVSLYGGEPQQGRPDPMRNVVRLRAPILQLREIDPPTTVGYGATHRAGGRVRVATAAIGYADGYLRSLSNRGSGLIGQTRVPLIGRVSMDLTTFDVSNVPEPVMRADPYIDVISSSHSIDDVARDAGTISYEILTSLGSRYQRVYVETEND